MAAISDKDRFESGYRFLHEYLQGKLEIVGKHLVEKNALTQAKLDNILAQRTQHEQCKKFLDEVRSSPSMFWGHIMDTIKEEIGDNYIVEYLHPNYVKKIVPVDGNDCKVQNDKPSDPDNDNEDGLELEEINVIPCTEFISNEKCYINDSNPRGLALIINIIKFKNREDRHGSIRDEMNLKSLYSGLGYEVIIKQNLSSSEMRKCLKDFAEDKRHKNLCSCIVTILSHGCTEGIYGSNYEILEENVIYELFDNYGSPHLQNKPKLFVIQACRGSKEDKRGIQEQTDSISTQINAVLPTTERSTGNVNNNPDLPVRSDMIIFHSTLLGYVALRHPENGSRFISTIVKVFKNFACKEHAMELLTQVNGIMKKKDTSGWRQQPEFSSTLDKNFYFFPGI